MCPEYWIEGKFPESKRILGIGPRRNTFTTLVTVSELTMNRQEGDSPYTWKGELEVDGKNIKGKIVFERGTDGKPLGSERELLDHLTEKYSVIYLRDKKSPAVETRP